MSKGVSYRPIFIAHKSAMLLGFKNTALMIEGLMDGARGLDYAQPRELRAKISGDVISKIGCIRSTLEKERAEYAKAPQDWFGWTRMNVFLAETLKGITVSGVVTYVGCSAASMFHFTGQSSFNWTLFFSLSAGMALRAIWMTAGSSRQRLINRINRSLSEIESLAKEYE